MNLNVLAESQQVGRDGESKEVTTTDPAAIAAQQNRRITKKYRTPSKGT